MPIRILILIFSLLGTGLAIYLGKVDKPNRGYWYGAAVMGANMTIFFAASLGRLLFGMEWWLEIFPVGFANEWSIQMYLFLSAYFLFFCLNYDKLQFKWLDRIKRGRTR